MISQVSFMRYRDHARRGHAAKRKQVHTLRRHVIWQAGRLHSGAVPYINCNGVFKEDSGNKKRRDR